MLGLFDYPTNADDFWSGAWYSGTVKSLGEYLTNVPKKWVSIFLENPLLRK